MLLSIVCDWYPGSLLSTFLDQTKQYAKVNVKKYCMMIHPRKQFSFLISNMEPILDHFY